MKKGTVAVLSSLIGAMTASAAVFRNENKKLIKEKELDRKNDAILKVFAQWLSLRQEGKTLVQYFKENGYKSIAIYGMHYLGEALAEELKDSGVEVKYAIDRNMEKIYSELEMYRPDEELPEVDVIVVSAFYYFDEIEEMLCEKVDCPIISIEDVIYEV